MKIDNDFIVWVIAYVFFVCAFWAASAPFIGLEVGFMLAIVFGLMATINNFDSFLKFFAARNERSAISTPVAEQVVIDQTIDDALCAYFNVDSVDAIWGMILTTRQVNEAIVAMKAALKAAGIARPILLCCEHPRHEQMKARVDRKAEMLAHWTNKLKHAEAEILRIDTTVYPDTPSGRVEEDNDHRTLRGLVADRAMSRINLARAEGQD